MLSAVQTLQGDTAALPGGVRWSSFIPSASEASAAPAAVGAAR
jgi:hypothetical protein